MRSGTTEPAIEVRASDDPCGGRTSLLRRARGHAKRLVSNGSRTPGQRFTTRFDERSHIPRAHPRRLARILLGLALFAFGMANIFIPGPGGSVFILASALVLSGESRTFARILDRGEIRFQRQIRWVIENPTVAVVTISSIVFVTMTFVTARLLD